MNWKKIILIIITITGLQGCVAAMLGGAAAIGVAGTAVIYDRRNIKTILNDESISHQIVQKLEQNETIKQQCHIVVSTYHQTVLLAGQIPTSDLKQQTTEIAKTVPGIRRLYNETTIQGPSSALTRSSDTWITTKVKTLLLTTKGLESAQLKVVTENGIVYLMGIVTRKQAILAVEVTRHVDGVQKVVKVFQYERLKTMPQENETPHNNLEGIID